MNIIAAVILGIIVCALCVFNLKNKIWKKKSLKELLRLTKDLKY